MCSLIARLQAKGINIFCFIHKVLLGLKCGKNIKILKHTLCELGNSSLQLQDFSQILFWQLALMKFIGIFDTCGRQRYVFDVDGNIWLLQ